MIPKVIHYCWFGKKRKSALIKDCIESWKKNLPEYEIKCWTEKNIPVSHPFLDAALKSGSFAFAADFVRLFVVNKYGGIYFDTDVLVIKSFDNLLDYDMFLGEEVPGRINLAVFGAIPGHPILKSFINFYDHHNFDPKAPPVISLVLTEVYKEIKEVHAGPKNKVFDYKYFYPQPYECKHLDYQKYLTANTYAVHLWNHSWRTEIEYLWNREYGLFFLKAFEHIRYNKKDRYNLRYYLGLYRSYRSSLKHYRLKKTDGELKVIFCAHDGKNIINGVNTWLLRLLPQLKDNGITVEVIVTSWVDEQDCTTIPILKNMGIRCTIIDVKKNYVEREVRWILEYVKKESPDIFVANDMFQAWYASKWIQQAGIPVIGVLHSDNIESEERVKKFARGKNGYMVKAIVTVSDTLFKKAIQWQNEAMLRKIPCGLPVCYNNVHNKQKETFNIAYVGRLERNHKRIDNITRAFCETINNVPNVRVFMYGDGCDKDLVNKIINEFGCEDEVILKGNISNNMLMQELLDIDAITLMSDFEGLPVSLMEAMSVGVVPICTRIKSGVPELLIENITGLYIDEPGQLKDKIKYLKDNPDVWDELSSNAKTHIAKNFSSQITDQLWLDLLNELKPGEKKEIKIPTRIILPPINKGISLEDNREPSLFVKAIRKTKRIISRLKT